MVGILGCSYLTTRIKSGIKQSPNQHDFKSWKDFLLLCRMQYNMVPIPSIIRSGGIEMDDNTGQRNAIRQYSHREGRDLH